VLSPQKTLERGYAIVRTDAALVTSRDAVAPGVRVNVRLADGSFGARVEDVDT
jgi:exonuclease VII large subunit